MQWEYFYDALSMLASRCETIRRRSPYGTACMVTTAMPNQSPSNQFSISLLPWKGMGERERETMWKKWTVARIYDMRALKTKGSLNWAIYSCRQHYDPRLLDTRNSSPELLLLHPSFFSPLFSAPLIVISDLASRRRKRRKDLVFLPWNFEG